MANHEHSRTQSYPQSRTQSYPQESAGVTLLSCEHGGERRRVFVRRRGTRLEVGEFTRGPLTRELYGAPAHHHCVQLGASASGSLAQVLSERLGIPREQGIADLLRAYFAQDEKFLAFAEGMAAMKRLIDDKKEEGGKKDESSAG